MTELDEALEQRMAFIVLHEQRPFSFKDLLYFEWGGKEFKPAYGTIRNKLNEYSDKGLIKLDYRTNLAYYTLTGHKFGKKLVTPNHTVVNEDSFYKMLKDLPLEKQSIHDIRLRFSVPSIWKILSVNPDFHINQRSKDIAIPSWSKCNAIVRVVVHKTDTVSVIISCSLHPIPLDSYGIIHFFNLLVRVEEKLQFFLTSSPISCKTDSNAIPGYESWVITMWHFGRDSLIEYTGQKFSRTVEDTKHVLTRVYSKEFGSKSRIRYERQDYPNKQIEEIIKKMLQ